MGRLIMKIFTIALFSILLSGCSTEQDQYRIHPFSGVEKGVRIEVMLSTGGTAVMICPKYSSKPISNKYGIQCYLERYDTRVQ